ncbi:hypothetical protein [Aurantiacibacter rhizosphaerae]|uniref:Copper resistance protein NlpE n=1 Tax=Aurantiacibacter rhizosphaerae TaxID=2691582 RepID=A0A844X9H8_9SPHN|nr:hypothetical protein [Aurantiacibacter rhizosphaerae]MWV26606.1 hypothetical protein [Aurantiacibacter rhizosphaerae]
MRKFIAITAAAPLALLAACGDSEPADDMETAPVETTMAADDATATMPADGPATTLDDSGDFSGTYNMQGDDGTSRSVTLNSADDSYEYTAADGTTRTGNYTRMDDGYRLQIEDFDGSPGYFTFSNGDLVRLQNDANVEEGMTVQGERYSNGNRDDAVFSREPELGSPVAPQN